MFLAIREFFSKNNLRKEIFIILLIKLIAILTIWWFIVHPLKFRPSIEKVEEHILIR